MCSSTSLAWTYSDSSRSEQEDSGKVSPSDEHELPGGGRTSPNGISVGRLARHLSHLLS